MKPNLFRREILNSGPQWRFALAAIALVGIGASHAGPALAQFKHVDANGKVTYSDRPPPPEVKSGQTIKLSSRGNDANRSANPELPFSLKQPATKYPVVLYTSPDCDHCNTARAHLTARGVPYSEKVIRNNADVAAFKGLGFSEVSFPAITIGSQRQNGFEAGALNTLLDAAGYPKNVPLPSGYTAKIENLTPEPAGKTHVRVAEGDTSNQASSGETKAEAAKARRERIQAASKPKAEPAIRF